MTERAGIDNGREATIERMTQAEHDFIRTVPTDGRWCRLCGLAEARWEGEMCPGEGAAEAIERKLVAARTALLTIKVEPHGHPGEPGRPVPEKDCPVCSTINGAWDA